MAYEVWSMIGALITAATFLPLLLSQPYQDQSSRLFRWVRSALFPNHAQCELVTWDMIPDGPLHTCARGYCPHWMPKHHAKCQECWTPCLQVLFNRALRDGRTKKYIAKPPELDFGGKYICVDVRIIIAIILCSTATEKSMSWREGSLTYGSDFTLELQQRGDILISHIYAQMKERRLHYTKEEISKLMSGYPPLYRESFVCEHGPLLRFPIEDARDVLRGGWIVAIGLADKGTLQPIALYNLPNLSDDRSDGSYFDRTNGA